MTRPREADLLLGVDAGTTLVKAAIHSTDGRCLASGEAPQKVTSLQPGWAEQDPRDWWRGVCRAVRQAMRRADIAGERIGAIGLSTQGGSLAIFDESGEARGPALVWSDVRQRGVDPSADLLDEHFRLTGAPHRHMTPGAIEWLRVHRPEWFERPYRIGYVPDYLTSKLTGEWVTDPTNLSISNLCDLSTGDVPARVIERLGVAREAFATTRHAGDVAGTLVASAAKSLGLRAGIPVATPAHDQYAASLGAGCTEAGDVLLSAGTAWVLLLTTREPVTDRAGAWWPSRHVQRGMWGLLGAISTGGSTLERVLDITRQRPDWARVNAAVAGVPPGSDGVLVIPHLVGRTLPTWDEDARGAVLGLSLGHRREHVWRAAMEGLALETRVACEYLARRGAPVNSIRMVGGAARSAVWPAIVASVLGIPVSTCASENMAVRGAACLAARALGQADLPHVENWAEQEPVAGWGERYEEVYARYRTVIGQLEKGEV